MSVAREIAEYSTELVVATSALASGAAQGFDVIAVPAVTLAAIGASLRLSCADSACRRGIARALRDIGKIREIDADDLARARLRARGRRLPLVGHAPQRPAQRARRPAPRPPGGVTGTYLLRLRRA